MKPLIFKNIFLFGLCKINKCKKRTHFEKMNLPVQEYFPTSKVFSVVHQEITSMYIHVHQNKMDTGFYPKNLYKLIDYINFNFSYYVLCTVMHYYFLLGTFIPLCTFLYYQTLRYEMCTLKIKCCPYLISFFYY